VSTPSQVTRRVMHCCPDDGWWQSVFVTARRSPDDALAAIQVAGREGSPADWQWPAGSTKATNSLISRS
jgi:hypothetical protein